MSSTSPMSISVVIAAYNASSFIAETLGSVLNQTLAADEVLVIDDGSTDNTAQIAESMGPPVRVFRRANAKQAASRNFGVQEAKGEWIAFVDADDLWEPTKLARQIEELGKHPSADVCYTARVEFSVEDHQVRWGSVIPVPPPEEIRQALFRNTTFLPSATMIRRSTFLASGGFDPKFNNVEDWDLWLRLYHRGVQFAACYEPLVQYRIHPNSASHGAISSLRLLKEIYRRQVYPHLPASTRWLSRLRSESGQEAVAALALRRAGDRRDLRMIVTSILRHPFRAPGRYKILAYMLYTRVRKKVVT